MKTSKMLFVCVLMTFLVTCYLKNLVIWYLLKSDTKWETTIKIPPLTTATIKIAQTKMIYILQWTSPQMEPFKFMESGQNTFIRRGCLVKNCYVTSNRSHLNSLKDFHFILFNGPELSVRIFRLPNKRSPRQKYVFISSESAYYYPFYYQITDGYFNWTWTYRLNSELTYNYLTVKDKHGDVIGPKTEMHWLKLEEMKPIDDKLKIILNSKKIAVAWFVSNCAAPSKRHEVAKLLQQELAKYNMTLDVYGPCGNSNRMCARDDMDMCLRMLETDYYFYLAFENSFDEDYVTEKILHALQHYTVPIVYGGANYTRFMPDGSYLNIRNQNIKEFVKQMVDIINDKQKYYDYFRWMNHYSFHYPEEFPESDYYCEFCRKINDFKLVNQTRYIKNIKNWWNAKATIQRNFTVSKSYLYKYKVFRSYFEIPERL